VYKSPILLHRILFLLSPLSPFYCFFLHVEGSGSVNAMSSLAGNEKLLASSDMPNNTESLRNTDPQSNNKTSLLSSSTEIHESTLLVTNRTPSPTGKPKRSRKHPKNKSSHCGPTVTRDKPVRSSKTHKKVTKLDNIMILDPVEKAVKSDDIAVPDPDQIAVLSEHDNYEPSAKKRKKHIRNEPSAKKRKKHDNYEPSAKKRRTIKFIIESTPLEPSHNRNSIANLRAESSKKESTIFGTHTPSHSPPVRINTHTPCSIPEVDDLKHSNCNNQFMFSDFMPEVPFTLPKENRRMDDKVKPVLSPLVDSHGADVGGTTTNIEVFIDDEVKPPQSPLVDSHGADIGGTTPIFEGVSKTHLSDVSAPSAVGNVITTGGAGQDVSQERVASNMDNNLVEKPILFSYVDVVDMSAHQCCGFSYILRLVDPIARVGHATPMKTNSSVDVISGFRRLMSMSRIQPSTIYYASTLSDVISSSERYSYVLFVEKSHSTTMLLERQLYLNQMKRWLKGYGNEWLRGALIVQAVTNTLSLHNVAPSTD
jgi:hypothetical protein